MIKINLLPQEISVNKSVANFAKIIKRLNIFLLVVFIVFALGLGVYLFFGARQLTSLEVEASDLETQIKSQQKVEQSMVLLKDRLVKIKLVEGTESAREVLELMDPVISLLPLDAQLGELSVDSKKIDMGVSFPSSASLNNFFTVLDNLDNFAKINLSNFSFNPSTGYLVGFSFEKK